MKRSFTTMVALTVLGLLPSVVRAQTSTINGTVTDGSYVGEPVPLFGATVELALIDGSRSAITDARGHYEFTGLESGRYTVTFSSRGVGSEERLVDLAPDSERKVDVCMAPRQIIGATLSIAARVTGVVRDNRTCATLGDVRVEVRRQGGSGGSAPVASTATSENGTYAFNELDQDDYTVTFRAEDYEEIRSPVEVRLGSAQPLHAYMPPRFRLSEERDEFGINPDTTTEIPRIRPVSPECVAEDCPAPRSPPPHPRVRVTFTNSSERDTPASRRESPAPPVTTWSNRPLR